MRTIRLELDGWWWRDFWFGRDEHRLATTRAFDLSASGEGFDAKASVTLVTDHGNSDRVTHAESFSKVGEKASMGPRTCQCFDVAVILIPHRF